MESHIPKIKAVGHNSNKAVALRTSTVSSRLPVSDWRNFFPSSSQSRRRASTARWGASKLVMRKGLGRSAPVKSAVITGSDALPDAHSSSKANSMRLAWDCTESNRTQLTSSPLMFLSSVA